MNFKKELSPSKPLLYSTQLPIITQPTNCVIYLGELRKINRGFTCNSQSYEKILS